MNRVLLVLSLIVLTACKSARNIERNPIVVEKHDTTTVVKEVIRFVKDTATYNVPEQSASAIVPDSSFLENDFSESSAWVDTCGLLHHNLKTKPHQLDIPYDRQINDNERITKIHDSVPVPYPVPEPYPVEKELTWWQHTSIEYFSLALWAVAILLIILFRKPIFNVIRKVFR